MFLSLFRRRDNPFHLAVGMSGVQMGDRLVQIGCVNAPQLAAIAGKVGLSGRAAAVVPDAATGAHVERAATRAGVLVEVTVSPLGQPLPVEDAAFDVAIVDDTAAAFTQMTPAERSHIVRETRRVLRPGGRVMIIGATARTGLGAALQRGTPVLSADPTPAFQADGYKTVRVLAERDGLIFYEGMKPRA